MSWETRTLGDLVTMGRKRPTDLRLSKEQVSFVPMAAVEEESGRLDPSALLSHEAAQQKTLTYFEEGDVLFAKVTPCMENGKIAVAKGLSGGAGYGSTEFHVLTPSERLDADYLFNFLVRREFRADAQMSMTGAVGLRRVPKIFLKGVKIPLPPLDEQKRIVAQLEDQLGKLEAVRARLKVIRDQLIQLRASALNENFGVSYAQFEWDRLPLSDVVIPIIGKRKTQRGWSPQCESHPASEGQWGVLKTTAVQMGWFEPTQNKALPSSLEPKPEVDIAVGDLLLLTTGPRNRCGIPALVDESPGKLMMSGKMARLRADSEKVLSEWLLLFLLSPQGQSELEQLKVGSSDSSVSIGAEVLLKIEVPVPTLEHQEKVVTDLAEVAATQRNVEAQLDDLEASLDSARSSTLHRAFLAPEEAL